MYPISEHVSEILGLRFIWIVLLGEGAIGTAGYEEVVCHDCQMGMGGEYEKNNQVCYDGEVLASSTDYRILSHQDVPVRSTR